MKATSKKILCLIVTVCLVSVLGISVYALSKSTSGNLNGVSTSGYLSCDGSWTYNCNASTSASSAGTGSDSINVVITFDEYNESYDASYDNPQPASATYTSVSGTGWNPDYISGSHIVVRGNYSWSGSTGISDSELD